MKFALVIAFLGTAAVSASEQTATLRGAPAASEYVYAPPPVTESTSLAALWDELAAEAAFMQVQIAEGRTLNQCKDDCDNDPDINQARCRQNCEQIYDQGNDSDTRTFNCNDCRTSFPTGGRRYDRCMSSCRNGQENSIEDCRNANTCGQCRKYCGTGNALDKCFREVGGCSGSDRRDSLRCRDARTCGECNSFCDDRDERWDCRDEFRCTAAKEAAEEEIAKKLAEMVHKKE